MLPTLVGRSQSSESAAASFVVVLWISVWRIWPPFEAFLKSLEGTGPEGPSTRQPSPSLNFIPAAQNDFATRMMWSVTTSLPHSTQTVVF